MTKTIDTSKLPPQAIETENMVIGTMLQHSGAIDTVSSILTPESFYLTSNQLIYEAILSLHARGRTPDVISVVEQLKSSGNLTQAGDPYGVTKLTNAVTSGVDIEGKCKKVQEKFILRELIRFSGDILATCYDHGADAFDVLDYAEGKILDMSVSHLNSDYTD
jgi:replicative DNA helicase